jgi:hypothetical protein
LSFIAAPISVDILALAIYVPDGSMSFWTWLSVASYTHFADAAKQRQFSADIWASVIGLAVLKP